MCIRDSDKVVLDFSEGISAIVGPNGCGKSNIVDAIRWVLGEHAPSYLRSKALEDVIFAGSDAAGPLGMAEVTLTFVNDDGNAPPGYESYADSYPGGAFPSSFTKVRVTSAIPRGPAASEPAKMTSSSALLRR